MLNLGDEVTKIDCFTFKPVKLKIARIFTGFHGQKHYELRRNNPNLIISTTANFIVESPEFAKDLDLDDKDYQKFLENYKQKEKV